MGRRIIDARVLLLGPVTEVGFVTILALAARNSISYTWAPFLCCLPPIVQEVCQRHCCGSIYLDPLSALGCCYAYSYNNTYASLAG